MLQYCISNFDKSKPLNENSVVIYLNNNIIENETTKPYCVFYYPSEYNQKIFNLNDTYLEHFDLKKTKSDYREEIEVSNYQELEQMIQSYTIENFGIKHLKVQYTQSFIDNCITHSIVLKNSYKIPMFECMMYDLLKIFIEKQLPSGITLNDFFINQGKGITKAFLSVHLMVDFTKSIFDYIENGKESTFKPISLEEIVTILKEIEILVGEDEKYPYYHQFISEVSRMNSIQQIVNTTFFTLCQSKRVCPELDDSNVNIIKQLGKGSYSIADLASYQDVEIVVKTPNTIGKDRDELISAIIQHRRERNYVIALQNIPGVMKGIGKIRKVTKEDKKSIRQCYTKEYFVTVCEIISKNVTVRYPNDYEKYLEEKMVKYGNKGNEQLKNAPLFFFYDIDKSLIQILDMLIPAIIFSQMDLMHRDFKPSNFFVTDDERIVIGDLGGMLMSVDLADDYRTGIGTVFYQPKDQTHLYVQDNTYCDIHALGKILLQYFAKKYISRYGNLKYNGDQVVQEIITEYQRCKEDYRNKYPLEIQYLDTVLEIIKKMIEEEYHKRCGWVYLHQLFFITIELLSTRKIQYNTVQCNFQPFLLYESLQSSFNLCEQIIEEYHYQRPSIYYESKIMYNNGQHDSKFFESLLLGHLSLVYLCLEDNDKENIEKLNISMKFIMSFHVFHEDISKDLLKEIRTTLKCIHDYILS